MKTKRLICLLLLFLLCVALSSCYLSKPKHDISYTELGIPSSDLYPDGIRARSPWDMIVWDGSLYVGGGDYDANTGPIGIYRLDLKSSEWESSPLLPEEEFDRFRVIDDRLTAPGIDPKESWEFGNYYVLQDGEWTKKRVIPNGVHTFDLAENDGLIFASLGVEEGYSPIAVSDDGGETFRPVEMWKDDQIIDTSDFDQVRSYDLFVLDGQVYASFLSTHGSTLYELYRYEDGKFVFDNRWNGKVKRKAISYKLICDQAVYRERLYLATGNLYVTTDLNEIEQIEMPNGELVYDVAVTDAGLYILCGEKREDGTVVVSVWKQLGRDPSDFRLMFDFVYSIPPLSFAVLDGTFYIGMSDTLNENESNGMILKVVYRS